MNRAIINILICFCILIGLPKITKGQIWPTDLWTDVVNTQPEGYVTDFEGNVHIYTAEGLAWLSVLSNGLHGQDAEEFENRTVYLEENIDLTGHAWTPIATYIWNGVYEDNHYFKGVFDGKQHLINNMILSKDFDISYVGLFGNIISGEIRNVVIDNCRLDFYYETTGYSRCGLLAYMLDESSKANNCYVHCLDFRTNTGGLFVEVLSGSSVTNCMVHYDFKYETDYGCGICDINQGVIMNCASIIDTLQWPYWYEASGIASINDASIKNCYSFWGELVAFPFYSPIAPRNGVAAYNEDGVVENCYYNRMPQVWQFDDSPGYGGTFQDVSEFDMENNDWLLMNPITIGSTTTNDLVEVLNLWIDNQPNSEDYLHWCADTTGFNHGLPIFANYDLTSVEDQCENVNIVVFPNPTMDIVHITGDNISKVNLYDMVGNTIIDFKKVGQSKITLDIKELNDGIYMIRIENIKGNSIIQKIIKQ